MAKHLLITTFLACLPDIQSAIKVGSDGMRIQLDIPETEKPKAVPLIAMTHKVLEVTIRELTKEELQSLNGTKWDYEAPKTPKGTGTSMDSGRSKLSRDKRTG
jgi:hypothetical protein